MDDHRLISTIPELTERKLYYDIEPNSMHPEVGDFLVTIGRNRKVNSVYQVFEVRKMNSRVYEHRYHLKVFKTPDMIPHATVSFRFEVKVMGEPAHPCFWHKSKKSKIK